MQIHDVPGWPGYKLVDKGQYDWEVHGPGNWGQGSVLKPKVKESEGGRKTFNFNLVAVGQATIQLGAIVLMVFVGPCPVGMECCHNDGDPTNNDPSNLRWDTHRNNSLDSVKHGTCALIGERNVNFKLSKEKLGGMLADWDSGLYLQRELAEKYGVSQPQVSKLVNGKRRANALVGG